MTFYNVQKSANEKYYKDPKTRIYYDFKTTSSACSMTALACAKKAARMIEAWEKQSSEPFRIAEFGIGEGDFAAAFNKELLKQVDSTRFEYVMFDFSKPLLDKAKKLFTKERLIGHFVCCDLANPAKFPYARSGHFEYVISNEMYDDLPASIMCRKGKDVFEAVYDMEGEFREYAPCTNKKALPFAASLPENYNVPVNLGGMENLNMIKSILRPGFGMADIFDYGFMSYNEIAKEPFEFWNQGVVRKFGTQLTTDVNFELLEEYAKSIGFIAGSMQQSDFIEMMIGEKLTSVELEDGWHYFTREQIKKSAKKLGKQGYGKEFIKGEYSEEEPYYCLSLKV